MYRQAKQAPITRILDKLIKTLTEFEKIVYEQSSEQLKDLETLAKVKNG